MFACGWCGNPIDSYAAHFAEPHGRPCQTAARRPTPRLIVIDGELTTDQIRRRALRDLQRNQRRDRLEEPGLTTYARRDRRGR